MPPSPPPTASPAPTAPPAQTVLSDDGLLAIDIPFGALSAPVDVSASALDRGNWPIVDGLESLPPAGFGYALAPSGLTFARPVRITREIVLPDDAEPAESGVPLILLAARSSTGTWEWLDDLQLTMSLDEGRFTVSGTTSHFSTLWGIGDTVASYELSRPGLSAPVGTGFSVTAGIAAPIEADEPVLGALISPTVDGPAVAVGATERSAGLASFEQGFRCDAAGSSGIAVEFTAGNLDGFATALDLVPADVTVSIEATISCVRSTARVSFQGACLNMVNGPASGFNRRLELDMFFAEANLRGVEVRITGAANDASVEGSQPQPGFWQTIHGVGSTAGLSIASAVATTSGGQADFTAELTSAIGDIPNDFGPNNPVGDQCAGFGF